MKEAIEKIKERLKKEYRHHWQLWCKKLNSEDWAYKDAYTKALSIVSEVEAEYGNGWIPCSERLPENDDDVLVWYRYRTMQGVNIVGSKETHGIGYYNKPTNSWLIYGGFGLYWNAVAWMPLPELYKPEKGA